MKSYWQIASLSLTICFLLVSCTRTEKVQIFIHSSKQSIQLEPALSFNSSEYYILPEILAGATKKEIAVDPVTKKIRVKNITLNKLARVYKKQLYVPVQETAEVLRYAYHYDKQHKTINLVKKPPQIYSEDNRIQDVNSLHAGEGLNIYAYIVPGKYTIACFYSNHCHYSQNVKPFLRDLVLYREDVVIRYINIDRPNINKIDFHSPLAMQYGIHATPHVKIYDKTGQLIAEDKAAKQMLNDLMKETYED